MCIDEKSLQLIGHNRAPLAMSPGVIAKDDYEYVRRGTSNLFVAVEPKAGQRVVSVTEQRGKVDFVEFITPKHASWLNMAEIESASSAANAWIAAWPIGKPCATKSSTGNSPATPQSKPSSGSSLFKPG